MNLVSRVIGLALGGLLSLSVGLIEIVGGPSLNPIVPSAERTAKEIAASTALVYISLRGVNAVLSTAQEVEVGAALAAQASVQPMKVLEPVDDTVERVADAVFAVAAGAAIASVGFGPVAALGLSVLGIGLILMAVSMSRQQLNVARQAALRTIRLGFALGLLLPVGFVIGASIGEQLTRPAWEDARGKLDRVALEASVLLGTDGMANEATLSTEDRNEDGLFGRITGGFRTAGQNVEDALDAVKRYRQAAGFFWSEADTIFSASLTMIAVFALRILLLPALLIWGALAMLRKTD